MTWVAAWWMCLQRGSLLNTDYSWLSPFKPLYHPTESYTVSSICVCVYRLLFRLLYNIPCTYIKWNNQKMFLVCSAPLLPDVSSLLRPPYAFTFPQSDLLSNTFQQPTPTTNSTPTDPCAFIFLIFLPAFFFWHGGTSWLQPLCFFRLVSSSECLWSALHPEQFYLFWPLFGGLFVIPLCVCPCAWANAMLVLLFVCSFLCLFWFVLHWLDVEKTWHITLDFEILICGLVVL